MFPLWAVPRLCVFISNPGRLPHRSLSSRSQELAIIYFERRRRKVYCTTYQ